MVVLGKSFASVARVLVPAAALALGAVPVGAQLTLPDSFTNLKVLPKEIGQQELLAVMRAQTTALGVRCWYCHEGTEELLLDKYDFAADKKPTKETARLMMKMVADLNAQYLAEVKSDRPSRIRVTCATCHHGQALPRPVEDVLAQAMDSAGTPAMIVRYRELRARYYGRDSYDFGPGPLNGMARRFATRRRWADAITLAELNLEFHPSDPGSHGILGQAYVMSGDTAKGIANLEKYVSLAPDDRDARARLERLKGGKAP
ncbi:MAG: c-type cytochrome [Gemmatimonadetes bacterium]|nr:c-type cytochrome [Gemmatimonadota bacterium]